MQIHVCRRCAGCGHVTGAFRWEIPWSRWAPSAVPAEDAGVLPPHACPDCGGTGALIELDETAADPAFPSRRGLRPAHSYAQHVALVLHNQLLGPTHN